MDTKTSERDGIFMDGKGPDEPIIEEAVEAAKAAVDAAAEAVEEVSR